MLTQQTSKKPPSRPIVQWQRPHWSRSGAAVSGPLVTAPPRTHIQFGSGDNFLPTSDCVCEYDTPSLDSLKYSFRSPSLDSLKYSFRSIFVFSWGLATMAMGLGGSKHSTLNLTELTIHCSLFRSEEKQG